MSRTCSRCGEEAQIVAVYDDPDGTHLGCELVDRQCPNGHAWTQPSTRMLVRSVGWGHDWKLRQRQLLEREAES